MTENEMLFPKLDKSQVLTPYPLHFQAGAGVSRSCLFTFQLSPVPVYTAW